MEKSKCCSCPQNKGKQILKKLWTCSFTSHLWKDFLAFNIEQSIWIFYRERFKSLKTNMVLSQGFMYKSINIYYLWRDSCINQLISITCEIYQSFDNRLEVRGVFLGISKAFDKVWHEDLIYKLRQNGVKGNLLDTLTNFLNDRK